MKIKKRLSIILCALSPMAMAYPAMAMPQDQWNCPLTDQMITSEMMDTAYRLLMPPEKYDSKTKEERADFELKLASALSACSNKFDWADEEYQLSSNYVTSGLAVLGATSRLIDAGVDEKPLRNALANLTDADWAAWASSDINVSKQFVDKLIPIVDELLLKQGFELRVNHTGYNKKVDDIVSNYFNYSYLLKQSKIALALPTAKKAPARVERSDADMYNQQGVSLYKQAQSLLATANLDFYNTNNASDCEKMKKSYELFKSAEQSFRSSLHNLGQGDLTVTEPGTIGGNLDNTIQYEAKLIKIFSDNVCRGRIDY